MQKKIKPVKGIDMIKEVQGLPKRTFLWKGIPEGSIGLITGVAKTGKTRFTENLAMSMAIGREEFFGFKMDGKPRKVLFVNLEENKIIFAERNAKQIQKLSEKEKKLFEDNYYVVDEDFPSFLNNQDDWQLLEEYIKVSGVDVVVIDSLTHMLVGEIEKSSVAQAFIQKFKKIKDLGKTIIVVHHNTKGNDKPIDQNSIAGSRVITQEFEFAYGLANSPYGTSYCCMLNNKYVECDNQTAYTYKIGEDGWVDRIGETNKYALYKDSLKKSKIDQREKLFLEYFQSKPNMTLTTKEILRHFENSHGLSERTVNRVLKDLVEEKKIDKSSYGKYLYSNGQDENFEEPNISS